jgi:hypothetical protein
VEENLMNAPRPQPLKAPSLTDYLVRYDLAATLEMARANYRQATPGAPRLLDQQEIAERFRQQRAPRKAGP